MTKICSRKDCQFVGIEQDVSNFPFRDKKKDSYRSVCKLCVALDCAKYYQDNREEIIIQHAQYNQKHREEKIEWDLQYRTDHQEEIKQYRQDNKEEIRITAAKYRRDHKEEIAEWQAGYKKKRRQEDPVFKFRELFSTAFYNYLKSNNINKDRNSTFKILGITPDEFREKIYSQFIDTDNLDNKGNIWMTPENQGVYDPKNWDENDSSTWKWQLDHIIPQSEFNPISIDDPQVKECWSLDNLRPYRADLNIKDGLSRVRHTKSRKNSKSGPK